MLTHDIELDIAVGHSADSKKWKNEKWTWSQLVDRLKKPTVVDVSYAEYRQATKEDKSKLKDIGGYFGGYLRSGRRKAEHVIHRQLISLDIDFAHPELWEDVQMQFNNAAVMHATFSHSPANPRYRLIMPLSRDVAPDEYCAVARKVAGLLDIELFDGTTFDINRLMFWPGIPNDVDYYMELQDGPLLDPDDILESYEDWTDSSQWPTSSKDEELFTSKVKKQQDPRLKRGLVGAFCKAYDIHSAIETFLSGEYESTSDPNRYTYLKGSASGGLIVYDDVFAFSHHGTDPVSGTLCNAFDLVRIHLYGHEDSDRASKVSFRSMETMCQDDADIKKIIAKETVDGAVYDFVEELDDEVEEESDDSWLERMQVDGKANYMSSATNISLILAHDKRLKTCFRDNLFDRKRYVTRTLPWRHIKKPEPMRNVDYSGLRNYIEAAYGIFSPKKIEDSLNLEAQRNSFHPVKEYLKSLSWDGKERLDRLLIDYLGAEDEEYSMQAIRKPLIAAVARIFEPGTKFDLVLTLVGKQGTGKSTFFNKLGGDWFSDSFTTVQGNQAYEQIQGAWLIEMAELAGLKKAQAEAIKHFITKQVDTFRAAYAHVPESHPRQCVFFGTTNSANFLNDPTGNRRFIPVDINPDRAPKTIWSDEFNDSIDQIWAEAVVAYKKGEKLTMSKIAERTAVKQQASHSLTDDRAGLIQKFLNTRLPEDWASKNIFDRRVWLEDELSEPGTVEREIVCMAEIWCECLGMDKKDMTRTKTAEIHELLRNLEDWIPAKRNTTFPIYGVQKYYERREPLFGPEE